MDGIVVPDQLDIKQTATRHAGSVAGLREQEITSSGGQTSEKPLDPEGRFDSEAAHATGTAELAGAASTLRRAQMTAPFLGSHPNAPTPISNNQSEATVCNSLSCHA